MLYLKEVSVAVELEDGIGYFVIKSPLRTPFVAEPDISTKLPNRLKQYAKMSLLSTTILAATNELRALVKPIGTVYPTVFEYGLDTSEPRPSLFIRDNDPSNHRVISIGCYTYNLYKGEVRAEKFREAVAASKSVERTPYWQGTELVVRLRPPHARPSRVLDTFTNLLRLF